MGTKTFFEKRGLVSEVRWDQKWVSSPLLSHFNTFVQLLNFLGEIREGLATGLSRKNPLIFCPPRKGVQRREKTKKRSKKEEGKILWLLLIVDRIPKCPRTWKSFWPNFFWCCTFTSEDAFTFSWRIRPEGCHGTSQNHQLRSETNLT